MADLVVFTDHSLQIDPALAAAARRVVHAHCPDPQPVLAALGLDG